MKIALVFSLSYQTDHVQMILRLCRIASFIYFPLGKFPHSPWRKKFPFSSFTKHHTTSKTNITVFTNILSALSPAVTKFPLLFALCLSSRSCVSCCCYKLLENPTIGHVKSKPTRDCIIHLLGLLIKNYNHLLG